MIQVQPPPRKLGVLLVGLGAVSTTFVAGVFLARKKLNNLYGSLTQMGRIRLGKRTENREPLIQEFVPLANLDSLVFGAWDIFSDNAYQAARRAQVLSLEHIEAVRDELEKIRPMPAAFSKNYVKKLDGPNSKVGSKSELVGQLRADIKKFKADNNCDALVVIWCASTEIFIPLGKAHQSLSNLEEALISED